MLQKIAHEEERHGILFERIPHAFFHVPHYCRDITCGEFPHVRIQVKREFMRSDIDVVYEVAVTCRHVNHNACIFLDKFSQVTADFHPNSVLSRFV